MLALLCSVLCVACWAEEPLDWRLVGLSAGSGLTVFSDSRSQISTYQIGDRVADGQWRVVSIAAEHVVLEPVLTPAEGASSQAVVLGVGQEVPEPSRVQPQSSVYFEVHGIVVDDVHPPAKANGPESRQ